MPLSPESPDTAQALSSYLASWEAIQTLVHRGQSWSGLERNGAYLNVGATRMANVCAVTGLDFADDARALAVTDWDQDGDLDLWLGNRTGPRLRFMRNQLETSPAPSHSITFLLQGTRSNRDAIGARVTLLLRDGNRRLQTVTAGDGFLSQSSGSVHFGLGRSLEPAEVRVRWPGGGEERYGPVERDHRYRVVEGSGRLRAESPIHSQVRPQLAQPLEPSAPASALAASAVLMSTPIAIPRLTMAPSNTVVSWPTSARALLVNLWASWCPPCLAELEDITRHAGSLRQTGLDVLALSVDTLDPQRVGDAPQVQQTLARMKFPFQSGVADPVWLEKMEVLLDTLFDRHLDFAVPTSFLIDSNWNVSAIYRGSVSMERLRRDMALIDASPAIRRDQAVPYPGRWYGPPGQPLLELVAREYQERFPDEAERFLRMALSGTGLTTAGRNNPDPKRSDQEQFHIRLNLVLSLLRQAKIQEAAESLRTFMLEFPDQPDAWVMLAEIARLRGRPDTAVTAYRKALDLKPDMHEAADRLARMLATHPDPKVRQGPEAVRWALRACRETGHADPQFLDTLAAAYAEAGEFDKAVATSEQAIRKAVTTGASAMVPDMENRLKLYRMGKPFHEITRSESATP